MMSVNHELAQTVVAHGVGVDWKDGTFGFGPNPSAIDSLEIFLTDWRVAGALLEKMRCHFVIYQSLGEWSFGWDLDVDGTPAHEVWNKSLPRAIIEGCTRALS